jgi:DNA (cytosine-5)-methyltransferase 1
MTGTRKNKSAAHEIAAVDLFCGAAGLSYGLKQGGVEVVAGIDLDPACRFPFEKNIGARFLQHDISALASKTVGELFGNTRFRVLAGCAPCQPFSGYTTKRRGIDSRWQLLLEFLRIVREIHPEIVTLENVPRLSHLPLWNDVVNELRSAGYYVSWGIVDASDYGVSQKRRRLMLLASRLGEIDLPKPTSSRTPPTVRRAIAKLPSVAAGDSNTKDRLHASRALTEKNLQRIRASRPAGTWREWPAEMRAECHKSLTGKTYPSVYGRMSWDRPAPTITTQFYGFGNGRFGHPDQDRAITLREGALLQSFPPNFDFVPPGRRINFREIGRLIGNAVPPALGKAIGIAIVDHIAAFSR